MKNQIKLMMGAFSIALLAVGTACQDAAAEGAVYEVKMSGAT